MSLKAFHIFFICASIALAVWFGAWSARLYEQVGASESFILALVSFGGAAILGGYGVWFRRKLKGESYL